MTTSEAPLPGLAPTPVSLRVGDVIQTTLRVSTERAPSLLALTAAAVAPFVVLDLLTLDSDPIPGINIISAIVNSWYFAAVTLLTFDALRDRHTPVGQTAAEGGRLIGGVFGTNLLSGILILLGTLLLVVPGLIVWAALVVAVPVRVIEKVGVGQAIERSRALTSGHWLSIWLVGVPYVAVLVGIVGLAFGPLAVAWYSNGPEGAALFESTEAAALSVVGIGLLQAVGQIYMTVAATVVYVRLNPDAIDLDADEIANVFT